MRNKDDFVARWKFRLAGLALYGACGERNDGPMRKIERVYEIPAEVEKLLSSMYQDLIGDDTPINGTPRPVVNGNHTKR